MQLNKLILVLLLVLAYSAISCSQDYECAKLGCVEYRCENSECVYEPLTSGERCNMDSSNPCLVSICDINAVCVETSTSICQDDGCSDFGCFAGNCLYSNKVSCDGDEVCLDGFCAPPECITDSDCQQSNNKCVVSTTCVEPSGAPAGSGGFCVEKAKECISSFDEVYVVVCNSNYGTCVFADPIPDYEPIFVPEDNISFSCGTATNGEITIAGICEPKTLYITTQHPITNKRDAISGRISGLIKIDGKIGKNQIFGKVTVSDGPSKPPLRECEVASVGTLDDLFSFAAGTSCEYYSSANSKKRDISQDANNLFYYEYKLVFNTMNELVISSITAPYPKTKDELPGCTETICHWRIPENHQECIKSRTPDLASSFCGMNETDIYAQRSYDDALDFLRKSYLTSLNNMNCAKDDYSQTHLTNMQIAMDLLTNTCSPVKRGNARFKEFIVLAHEISKFTNENLCCCVWKMQTCSTKYKSTKDGTIELDELHENERNLLEAAGYVYNSETGTFDRPSSATKNLILQISIPAVSIFAIAGIVAVAIYIRRRTSDYVAI